MSTRQNPIGTMFDMQRSAVEGTQRAVHQGLDAQVRAMEMFADGVERGETAREQGVEVTEAATHAYFDMLDSMVPGDAAGVERLRETTIEQIEVAGEINEDVWETTQEFARQNAEVYGEFAEEYAAMTDDAFDAFLRTHEQAQASAESAADAVQQQTRTATEIAIEGAEQAADAVEGQD